jgi:hypothetical protein
VKPGLSGAGCWLDQAVRRAATTYARRGDRVLLAAPSTPAGRNVEQARHQDPVAPWHAVAQTLTNLGRPTHVRGLASLLHTADSTAPHTAAESGLGPVAHQAGPTDPAPDPESDFGESGPPVRHPCPLVLAPLDSSAEGAEEDATIPWARLMTRNGTLIIIIHRDYSTSRRRHR